MEEKELQIALYDGCQYFCTFCMYEQAKDKRPLSPKDTMTDEDWLRLIESSYERGYRVLNIAGRGEPTLHPSFARLVAKAYKLGFRICLLTNGLNDQAIIKVLPLIQNIRLNLSGLTESELKDIHKPLPGFSFDRCIASIRKIIRAIEEKQSGVGLYINYVLTTQTVATALAFPERVNRFFAADLKSRKIFVSYWHYFDYVKVKADNLGLSYKELEDFHSAAMACSQDRFLLENTNLLKIIDQTSDLLKAMHSLGWPAGDVSCGSPQALYTCEAHKSIMTVDGNGDCYGCFSPFRTVNGLSYEDDPFFFGNLKSKNIAEIFQEKNGFDPVMDVSNKYWKSCLTCVAKKRSASESPAANERRI